MGAEIDAHDLVQAAAAGDSRGWDDLVERFGALVWSTARAYGLSPDEGADVAQTTWLRLAEQLGRLRDGRDRIGVWLASTARKESLRLLGTGSRTMPPRARRSLRPRPPPRRPPGSPRSCSGGSSVTCPSTAGACSAS
jgi:DNA-directed RNA polymerase specialized sigma24 family protein